MDFSSKFVCIYIYIYIYIYIHIYRVDLRRLILEKKSIVVFDQQTIAPCIVMTMESEAR